MFAPAPMRHTGTPRAASAEVAAHRSAAPRNSRFKVQRPLLSKRRCASLSSSRRQHEARSPPSTRGSPRTRRDARDPRRIDRHVVVGERDTVAPSPRATPVLRATPGPAAARTDSGHARAVRDARRAPRPARRGVVHHQITSRGRVPRGASDARQRASASGRPRVHTTTDDVGRVRGGRRRKAPAQLGERALAGQARRGCRAPPGPGSAAPADGSGGSKLPCEEPAADGGRHGPARQRRDRRRRQRQLVAAALDASRAGRRRARRRAACRPVAVPARHRRQGAAGRGRRGRCASAARRRHARPPGRASWPAPRQTGRRPGGANDGTSPQSPTRPPASSARTMSGEDRRVPRGSPRARGAGSRSTTTPTRRRNFGRAAASARYVFATNAMKPRPQRPDWRRSASPRVACWWQHRQARLRHDGWPARSRR